MAVERIEVVNDVEEGGISQRHAPRVRAQVIDEERNSQKSIIRWEDPQYAARVEAGQRHVPSRAIFLEQEPGDQEPAQHEKRRYAKISRHPPKAEVIGHHGKYRSSSEPVQCRQVP